MFERKKKKKSKGCDKRLEDPFEVKRIFSLTNPLKEVPPKVGLCHSFSFFLPPAPYSLWLKPLPGPQNWESNGKKELISSNSKEKRTWIHKHMELLGWHLFTFCPFRFFFQFFLSAECWFLSCNLFWWFNGKIWLWVLLPAWCSMKCLLHSIVLEVLSMGFFTFFCNWDWNLKDPWFVFE